MRLLSKRGEQGSTLVLTLVMCVTIGVVLASYLSLIGSRYTVTMRSQCWNAAVAVMEAGVEEAMTHLNVDLADAAANGWTPGTVAGVPVHWKQRNFSDGSYFYVNIYNADTNNPYIYSTGFVPAPLDPGHYISRTVRVLATNIPLVTVAFAAIHDIQMNGSGLASDSFNSGLTNLSTNGKYDPSKSSTNGDVASVYGPVDFGGHTISGDLFLGPTATNVSVGSGQVSGNISSDWNTTYPDAKLPATTYYPAPLSTVGKSTFHDFSSSGDYYVTDSLDLVVEPGAFVRVRVDTTKFNPVNIHVKETNGVSGTLYVYQVSGSSQISGSVTVDSGRPRNFYYYGLPDVTSIEYKGASSFIGVVYAPEADLKLSGGGSNCNLIGASVSKTLVMGGHYMFHFDEDLLTGGPIRGFVANSWLEL